MSTPATPTSCDILVFGGTGDLALHKLLPALYRLHREDRLGLGRPDPRRLARALPEPAALPGRQQRPGTGATAAGTAGSTLAGMTRTLIRLRIARRALG
ncbi:hypothetical protein FA292_05645 [Pseudomonas aeruginosa]|nr:hypothetical protein [Pseudomonas aeruginosa]